MLSLQLQGAVMNLNRLMARIPEGDLRARLVEQQAVLARELDLLSRSTVDQALFGYFAADAALDTAIREAEAAMFDTAKTLAAIRQMDDAIKEVTWFRQHF